MKRLIALSAVLLASVVGCGSSEPGMVAVGGVVSLDEKPIGGAAVIFHHSDGRTASAVTNDDGTFQLASRRPGDGVPTGDYRVTVCLAKQEGGVLENVNGVEESPGPVVPEKITVIVPTIYNDPNTSPITATVAKSMKFKIDLNSKQQ